MVKQYKDQPYNDDVDHALSSRYDLLVANPGRTLQTREFIQSQSLSQQYLKRLADTLHKDGEVISGLSPVIKDNKITLTPGKVYLDGLIRDSDGGTVTITGMGVETVNVSLSNKLITETDDRSLLDPVVGYNNEGKAGAYRNQYTVKFTVNDPSSPAMYTLIDGIVQTSKVDTSLYDEIISTLERRTYEESGNYRVNGLEVVNPAVPVETDSTITMMVTAGTSFIQGREVTKPANSRFLVDKAITTSNTINELKNYTDGTLVYKLNNQWARKISRVTMDVYQEKSVTRGSVAGGKDQLVTLGSSIVDILSVTDGTKNYVYGTDYTLDTNNTMINWSSPTGNEPASGSTYVVDMVTTIDVDESLYTLDTDNNTVSLSPKAPVPYHKENTKFTSTFKIEYDFYLARRDLVLIGRDSVISVIKGNPNLLDRLVEPTNGDPYQLELATLTIYPQSNYIDVENTKKIRLTMDDLYSMKERVDQLEQNLSITNLDREAKEGEDATLLTGIYTDAMINTNKLDISHKDFSGAIDLLNNQFTVESPSVISSLTIDDNNVTTQYGKVGPFITSPFTESISVDQTVATGVVNVNEYAVFDSSALIEIDPSIDNWIDEKNILVNKTEHHTLDNYYYSQQMYHGYGKSYDTQSTTSKDVTTTSSSTASDEDMISFMRSIKITITGSSFYPFSDNIKASFNGSPISIVPEGTTQSGTNEGTVRADSDGSFKASFMIPTNIESGSVEVKVTSDRDEEATAVFTSQGILKKLTTTVTNDITTYNSIHVVHHYDPVAQTFLANTNTTLTSVGLYFSAKDETKPIIVELRDTDNGYPGSNLLSQKIVYPRDVKISENGTAETKVTFDDIIYLEEGKQYSVAVLTDSNKYFMYKASLGETQINSSQVLSNQPYNTGNLFTSSDGSAWTSDPKSDLKFRVYTSVYNANGGQIVFKPVTADDFNRLLVTAEYIDKTNAGLIWNYSLDDGKSWNILDNWIPTDTGLTSSSVSLKLTIKVNKGMSPMILNNCLSLVTFSNSLSFNYVSRNISVESPYTELKVSVDSNYQSSNALSMHVYYSSDINGTTWNELTNPTVSVVNQNVGQELNRFVFDSTGLAHLTNYRVKVSMSTNDLAARPVITRLINIMRI